MTLAERLAVRALPTCPTCGDVVLVVPRVRSAAAPTGDWRTEVRVRPGLVRARPAEVGARTTYAVDAEGVGRLVVLDADGPLLVYVEHDVVGECRGRAQIRTCIKCDGSGHDGALHDRSWCWRCGGSGVERVVPRRAA